jgi:hypothetical protein
VLKVEADGKEFLAVLLEFLAVLLELLEVGRNERRAVSGLVEDGSELVEGVCRSGRR